MARGLTFDAGYLIAAEKRSAAFHAVWSESVRRRAPRTVPLPVLAQVWRDKGAMVARVLKASTIESFTEERARQIGRLLGKAGTGDIVDAAVVLGAVEREDAIVTSDPDDIKHLLDVLDADVPVIDV